MKRAETWIAILALGSLRFAACAGETTNSSARTGAVCERDTDCATTERCVSQRCVPNTDSGSGLFGTGGRMSVVVTGGRVGAGGIGPSIGASGGQSSGGAGATPAGGTAGSGFDASTAVDGGCRSGTYPLAPKLDIWTADSSGRCFAELPPGVDLQHAVIQSGIPFTSSPVFSSMRRNDAPCTNLAAYRAVDADTIEICAMCMNSFGLAFQAVVDCASTAPGDAGTDAIADAGDGCVGQNATVRIQMAGGQCTVDLPPDIDRSKPLTGTLGFGILGGGGVIRFNVRYTPNTSCDDPQNVGWQPIQGSSSVRLCQGICSQPLGHGFPLGATLKCGVEPSD